MKTKPYCVKKLRSAKSQPQIILDQTQFSSSQCEKRKNYKIQILTSHTSMKSKPVSHLSSVPKLKKGVSSQKKSNKDQKKSAKSSLSIKVKKIEKIQKLKVKTLKLRKGKKLNNDGKGETKKSNKKLKQKKKIKLNQVKQENFNDTKSETLQIKNQVKQPINFHEEITIDFDDNAQIRMFFLTKQQIILKKQNLLSRNIEDWSQLSKIKIHSRELRNLNI